MRYFKIPKDLQQACAGVMLIASFALAANPDTDKSDKNYDTQQPNTIGGGAQKVYDGGNRVLNKLDKGIHKGGKKAKDGAEKGLNKVDDSIHDRKPAEEPADKPTEK